MSSDSLPYFQQLQQQLTAFIRNPDQVQYAPVSELEIEPRRLKIYEELFFNNIHDFFSQLFPVCKELLGEARWAEVVREYMVKHQSQTPLFHELGEEFLDFLQNEFTPQKSDPQYFLELAHYEWVELALAISEEKGFVVDQNNLPGIDLHCAYQLSPLAWPLAYEWPVHQISQSNQPTEKPLIATTLLVYSVEDNDALDFSEQDKIDFMELSPVLYSWLINLTDSKSALEALLEATQQSSIEDNLAEFAKQTLEELQRLGVVRQSL